MFIDQMILEIGVVDDPERVGFYSGAIESCFGVLSFLAGTTSAFDVNEHRISIWRLS